MANYSLSHFGDLDLQNLEEYYDVEIDFNEQKIQIDLNFENKSIDTKRAQPQCSGVVRHPVEHFIT
jgi:hypothetical protein